MSNSMKVKGWECFKQASSVKYQVHIFMIIATVLRYKSTLSKVLTKARVSLGHKLFLGSANLKTIHVEQSTAAKNESQVRKAPSRNRASGRIRWEGVRNHSSGSVSRSDTNVTSGNKSLYIQYFVCETNAQWEAVSGLKIFSYLCNVKIFKDILKQ